jgi:methyl-accepting chemotaxis protein
MTSLLRNASLGVKLALGFGIVIVLLAAAVGLGVTKTESIQSDAMKNFADDAVPLRAATEDLPTQLVAQENGVRGFLITADDAQLATYAAAHTAIRADLAAIRPHLAQHPGMSALVGRAQTQIQGIERTLAEQIALARTGAAGQRRALAQVASTETAFAAFTRTGDAITREGDRIVAEDVVSQDDEAAAAKRTLIVIGIVAVLIAIAAGTVLTVDIRRRARAIVTRLSALRDQDVAELAAGMDALAEGDLTRPVHSSTEPIENPSRDEIGQVASAANAIRESTIAAIASYNGSRTALDELVGAVSRSASTVSASSEEMATTSEEATRAVSEIAGAVSEVAQGAERQQQMVSATSVAAAATAAAATGAHAIAMEGATASAHATEAMTAVRDASTEAAAAIRALAAKSEAIGSIVDTIGGIAQQTNLLALNAAIEAARAGDQGRGFAVVAEEVRHLAVKSSEAASTISGLVAEIQGGTQHAVDVVELGAARSQDGADVVHGSRSAFDRIAAAVGEVSGRVDDIAKATSEVAAAAEQSSASAEQVSASTEETSASSQQIAASAQELARTAEELEALVQRFTITTF